ncbi:MAG TPA: hypothetical protein ENK17_00415, partial [Anaerolineae bacterium]|nr:hypothetical protein [Anaerolineae bacterium]
MRWGRGRQRTRWSSPCSRRGGISTCRWCCATSDLRLRYACAVWPLLSQRAGASPLMVTGGDWAVGVQLRQRIRGCEMLKFPYGISDFHKLITGGYWYVDRTEYIRDVEEIGPVLLFLRPRRFGKSLWLSTLENYYDVAKADEFERLFGHLAIGQNPTPLHNRYLIMRWNFSVVDPQGDNEAIQRSLYDHLNASIISFARRYRALLPDDIEVNRDNALFSLASALSVVQ